MNALKFCFFFIFSNFPQFPIITALYENLTELILEENKRINSCEKKNIHKSVYILGNKWNNMPDDVSKCSNFCKISPNINEANVIIWHVHIQPEPDKKNKTLIAFGMEPKNLDWSNFLMKSIDYKSSFRLDYDIPFLYFDHDFIERSYSLKIPSKEEFDKMKDIIFISSNCNEQERNEFVKRLDKVIKVDSRGVCMNNAPLIEGNWLMIEPQVMNQYKFYIGFDKDLNSQYVSEKFQTGFLMNSVPLYRGTKRAFDYAPGENSFIHIDDFTTPEDFGMFLKNISNDYNLWKKYFNYRLNEMPANKKLLSNWLHHMKASTNGRDKGNLCRFCDHVCFYS